MVMAQVTLCRTEPEPASLPHEAGVSPTLDITSYLQTIRKRATILPPGNTDQQRSQRLDIQNGALAKIFTWVI
jgi:hypothetical protein